MQGMSIEIVGGWMRFLHSFEVGKSNIRYNCRLGLFSRNSLGYFRQSFALLSSPPYPPNMSNMCCMAIFSPFFGPSGMMRQPLWLVSVVLSLQIHTSLILTWLKGCDRIYSFKTLCLASMPLDSALSKIDCHLSQFRRQCLHTCI